MTLIKTMAKTLGISGVIAEGVLDYLRHYGRLDTPLDDSPHFLTKLTTEIADLQLSAGISPSGLPTTETLDVMGLGEEKSPRPRCGCSDVQRIGAMEAKWRKSDLTYYIQDYVTGLAKAEVDELVKEAFKFWTDVCGLRITKAAPGTKPDLVISVGRGRGQNFDGPSGTLAYAYLPNGSDGQLMMRFDLDETWVKEGQGIRFLNVACHEFGHMLGLDHSRTNSALMAPFYSPGVSKPQANDDIPRIQALYGPPVNTPTPPSLPNKVLKIEFPNGWTGTPRILQES